MGKNSETLSKDGEQLKKKNLKNEEIEKFGKMPRKSQKNRPKQWKNLQMAKNRKEKWAIIKKTWKN